MSRPVVTIPHRLSRQEAVKRLKAGFSNVRSSFGQGFVVVKDEWAGDHLDFRASLLGRPRPVRSMSPTTMCGSRCNSPGCWLLAEKAKALVQREGRLMLEKPSDPRPKS